ncbi:MAG TPA: STAS domain-containing protein [Jatrophihabitantaceae bacterium]|jgi:anti-anti-sigma factor
MHPVRPSSDHRSGQTLTLTVTTHNHHVVAHATGHLDRSTATLLEAFVEHEIRRGYRHISVDLDQVSSVDEDGLAALRQTHESLHALGGHLDVRGIDPSRLAAVAWTEPPRRYLRLLPPIDP